MSDVFPTGSSSSRHVAVNWGARPESLGPPYRALGRKNGVTSERGEGSRQEKWDQKFGDKTARVCFSSSGVFVESG